MDLIIKPLEQCNFKCTYCSSTQLVEDKKARLSLDKVRSFLTRFPNTKTIIVNGGEPLLMSPDYYWKIIEFLDDLNMKETTLSFTSNLWLFKKDPNKWLPLFRHMRVSVGTSFDYRGRIKDDGKPYTEDEFWSISNLCANTLGYRPNFISVITEETLEDMIPLVLLAKKMDVLAKLNRVVSSGKQHKPLLLPVIYRKYLEIIDQGLANWEHNASELLNLLQGRPTICPIARDCESHIRVLQPDNSYYSCGSFGDDRVFPIHFEKEMQGTQQKNFQTVDLHAHHQDCYSCFNFSLCNGCRKTIVDVRNHNLTKEHCKGMKALIPQFQALKG